MKERYVHTFRSLSHVDLKSLEKIGHTRTAKNSIT